MRTLKKVRKISHDNFVESYGVVTRSKSVEGRAGPKSSVSQSSEIFGTFRRRKTSYSSVDEAINQGDNSKSVDYNDNCDVNNVGDSGRIMEISSPQLVTSGDDGNLLASQAQHEIGYKGPSNRRLRRFSLKKFPSTGDIHKASKKTDREAADYSLAAEAPARITSWHSQFTFNKKIKGSTAALRSKSPSRTLFQVPALSMTSASQSGYMDRRNRKKKWEKLWCVLHDSCLFCYHSPQSEFTQDAVVLRGYVVSADISDVQRAKFTFKLEKKSHPTYHFRCDNHKTFMQWICMIKKESSSTPTQASDSDILMNSVKNSSQTPSQLSSTASTPNQTISPAYSQQSLSRRNTAESIFRLTRREHLELELQKENLLREVLEQQKEIIKERNSIMSSPSPDQGRPYYLSALRDSDTPKPTKNEVMEKYERVKDTQQMRILKSLTQLHRRRNSVQLKIDQLSRDSRPKRGSRHANRYVIQSMQARLDLLRSELGEIDNDIRDQQASKEDIMDSLNCKRDLEIMVLDQQECLDIVKRGQPSPYRNVPERGRARSRRQSSVTVSSSSSSYTTEHLTSIDESPALVSRSDSSSTSSGLSLSCMDLNGADPGDLPVVSTPRCESARPFESRMSLNQTTDFRGTDMGCNNSCINKASSNDHLDFRGTEMASNNSCIARDSWRDIHGTDMERDISYTGDTSRKSSSDFRNAEMGRSKASLYSCDSVEGALSDDFRSLSASSCSDLDGECPARASSSDEFLSPSHDTKKDEIRPDVLAEIEDFEIFSKMMLQRLHSAKC